MSAAEVLAVDGLHTRLGTGASAVEPVSGVSFTLHAGQTFALLGESGCGKSMTALSILRLLPADGRITAGHVRLQGVDLPDLPEQAMRRERGGRIGMIFQEPMTSLNPVLTVGEQIAEAVRLHDPQARGAVAQRVVELLGQVGIPEPGARARAYPHQLSGGMKQRVMIAMALAGRPQLLIADEPTTALDVTIQAQVLQLLQRLQRETGMAILLITHDLGVVAEVADHVAVMYAGQIVEQASAEQFFARPAHPYSRRLFRAQPGVDKRGRALEVIPGRVPALTAVPEGCRFAPRCAQASAACAAPPPWRGAAGEGYRCHLDTLADPDATLASADPAAASDSAPSAVTPPSPAVAPAALLTATDLQVHFPIQRGVLRRTVGQVRAVDGVSLALAPGETLALVGESGCGKTTVGKALLQLVPPTGGQVAFGEVTLSALRGRALRRHRRDLQIIFQDPGAAMNPRMTVGEIVAEGMQALGVVTRPGERAARVAELLAQVGLEPEAANRYPHAFSGGQRQRICIARALAVEPRLIVCDEPTSALDVSVQAQVLNLLKDLQQRLGLSYLFISHDLAVVGYLAQRIAVMYLGRVVEEGPADALLERPLHPYTQALLAAVPSLGRGPQRQALPALGGDLPSPVNPPSGCHFHPRCPQADDLCRQRYPRWHAPAPGRRVACWQAADNNAPAAATGVSRPGE